MAASKKMIIHQMDVDTAFLNAPLEEDIYMIPPDGYDIARGKVLKLKRVFMVSSSHLETST
jgi:hypothetical protein